MKSLILTLLTIALTTNAFATTPSTKSVEDMLEASKAQSVTEAMHKNIDSYMRASFAKAFEGRELSKDEIEAINLFLAKSIKNINDELSWEKIRPMQVRVFQETYSQDEINGLTNFYKSRTGKAFVDKMPIVIEKSMELMQARTAAVMQRAQSDLEEFAKKREKESTFKPIPDEFWSNPNELNENQFFSE